MSFLKRLFGGSGRVETPATAKKAEYKGFLIEAQPYKEAGQYQLAGVIRKEVGGAMKEHRFVRADRFTDIDDAAEIALSKARQIIDEQGENVFSPR